MNALKTGAYSRQFALLGRLFAGDPKVRDALITIGARVDRKQAKASEFAAVALTNFVKHCESIAAGRTSGRKRGDRRVRVAAERPARTTEELNDRLNFDLPVDDWESIKEAAARLEQELTKENNSRWINQTPNTRPQNQSIPTHETTID